MCDNQKCPFLHLDCKKIFATEFPMNSECLDENVEKHIKAIAKSALQAINCLDATFQKPQV